MGTSCTKNENNMDLFSRLITMDEKGSYGKSYMVDTIVAIIIDKQDWDKDCYLK